MTKPETELLLQRYLSHSLLIQIPALATLELVNKTDCMWVSLSPYQTLPIFPIFFWHLVFCQVLVRLLAPQNLIDFGKAHHFPSRTAEHTLHIHMSTHQTELAKMMTRCMYNSCFTIGFSLLWVVRSYSGWYIIVLHLFTLLARMNADTGNQNAAAFSCSYQFLFHYFVQSSISLLGCCWVV